MKACLKNLEMLCFREKSAGLIANQQNEKSTQIYSNQLWIRGPAINAIMGKSVIKDGDYKKIHIKV